MHNILRTRFRVIDHTEFILIIVGCKKETLVVILKNKLGKKLFQRLSYFILKMAENSGTASVKKKTSEAVEYLQDSNSHDDSSSEYTESDGSSNI